MKSPLEAPEKQIAEETSAKSAGRTDSSGGEPEKPAATVIDTSKMAKGQREELELAEAAPVEVPAGDEATLRQLYSACDVLAVRLQKD